LPTGAEALIGRPGDRPRLRIAFVYDALVPYCTGGAERRFHELARRLAIRHDVHYVTWRYWGDDPILIQDGITYHGVGVPRPFYGADGRRILREQLAFAARVPAALLRIGADVVDVSATPFLPLYAAWPATRFRRARLVATWHEYWGEHWHDYLEHRPVTARLARRAESAARRLADAHVAVSSFTARRLAASASAGAFADRGTAIDVVPNGVELTALAAAGQAPSAVRPIDVVFVGRLIEEKRLYVLVRALPLLTGRRPGIRCEIVGDGPERESLVGLVRELGVEDQVALTGRVSEQELPVRLGGARMLALPSEREGYGIAVVEAQAAGAVPIVARGPLSAAPDLVADGVDGLLVEGTPEAFAAAIDALLEAPDRLERLAAAARHTAAGRGWDDRAAEMERIYVRLATRSESNLIRARSGSKATGQPEPQTRVSRT
jgi:glycosyltransferase involved in cell wall biosynthesis